MVSTPSLSDPVIQHLDFIRDNEGNHVTQVEAFEFQCHVTGYEEQSTDDGARFNVTFMFGTKAGPTYVTNSTRLMVALDERELTGNLGNTVIYILKLYTVTLKTKA